MPALFAQDPGMFAIVMLVVAVFVLIAMLVMFLIFAQYFRWWIQSLLTDAGVTFGDLNWYDFP